MTAQNVEITLEPNKIFRPVKPEGKFKRWLKKKLLTYVQKSSAEHKRYHRIHWILKHWFVYPGLKFIEKYVVGKYCIKGIEDIPKEWWNNHQRIFYYCYEDALYDTWAHMIYKTRYINGKCISSDPAEDYKTGDDYYKKCITHSSQEMRRLALQIYMTEILEDTVDREFMNFFMLHIYHELHAHYGGNVPKPTEYPTFIYPSAEAYICYPYFLNNHGMKVWQQPKLLRLQEVKNEASKTDKQDTKPA